jgi:hypothetical protein
MPSPPPLPLPPPPLLPQGSTLSRRASYRQGRRTALITGRVQRAPHLDQAGQQIHHSEQRRRYIAAFVLDLQNFWWQLAVQDVNVPTRIRCAGSLGTWGDARSTRTSECRAGHSTPDRQQQAHDVTLPHRTCTPTKRSDSSSFDWRIRDARSGRARRRTQGDIA